jgi:flavin-dependent dehydrogenase
MHASAPITIIGAGPGGLYAAMRLSQMGIPSRVFEKATFPRPKVCGDILTSNVLRALNELNPVLVADLLQQPWAMELKATAFGSARKSGFVMPFNSPANQALGLPSCASARRMDFDHWLYQQAANEPLIEIVQDCGVKSVEVEKQLIDGEYLYHYKIHTTQGTLDSRYLILALGTNSPLARQLVPTHRILPKHTAVGMQLYFQGATSHQQAHLSEYYLFDRKWMPGGLYITPFADGSVNVNAVMRLDVFQKRRPKLPELMRDYIVNHPQLRERFSGAKEEGVPAGCTLFFGTKWRPLRSGNCLLVGDAAGLTDATNANGIGHAMISGGIAAEHIALSFAPDIVAHEDFAQRIYNMALKRQGPGWNDELDCYESEVYSRLRNALRPGKVMGALFGNPLTAGLSVSILNASLHRLNSHAVEELVYSADTAATLLNPRFYWRLFAKQ